MPTTNGYRFHPRYPQFASTRNPRKRTAEPLVQRPFDAGIYRKSERVRRRHAQR